MADEAPAPAAVETPAPTPTLMSDAAPAENATTAEVVEGNAAEENAAEKASEETEGAESEASTEEPAAAEGAPEEYKFEFAEGTAVDDEAVAELSAIAKELNIPQAEAQKLASVAEKMSQKWAEGLQNHILETRTSWRDAVTSDKEIGGDKMAENLSVAKSAIEAFGSPELKAMLDDTGIGDNPEFIRFAYRVGKANSEHDFVKSGKPAAEVSFYDHPSSKPRK